MDRSDIMRRVRSSGSGIERCVQSALHRRGFRYRLHPRELPGRPDIVLPRFRMAVFVHGCFWHGHQCARGSRVPKTNTEYWVSKIARNVTRDARSRATLRRSGWSAYTVWECGLEQGIQRTLRELEHRRGAL